VIKLHIVYHCVEGCHCSATAAAIHLDFLPIDTKPSYHDFLNVPFFNNLNKTDKGRIILRGTDEFGNKIYTLCRSYVPHIVLPTILDVWEYAGGNKKDLLLVNTQHYENRFMKISNVLSKQLNIKKLSESLAIKGTLNNYEKIAEKVKETKKQFS